MGRYKKYENLPWWLNNLNGHTLTPTQKEVLDLDYYCKKFGTKLSHEKAAEKLDRGRHTIYVARRRLEELRLRSTLPAKGSFKLGYPLEYPGEAEWRDGLQSCGVDPRRFKMKRKSSRRRRPLRGLSSSKVSEASASEAAEAGVSLPQTPGGSTNLCSGEGGDSEATQKIRDELFQEVVYKGALNKLLKAGWPREKAECLAKVKVIDMMAKRAAKRKTK
ncbi:hypothetical protein ES703_74993 [subsurface metagenome]